MRRLCCVVAGLAVCLPMQAQSGRNREDGPKVEKKNVIVYQEKGRFGGWPANHGIWSWGDEILVGFETGYFKDNPRGHDIDYSKPAEHVLARSLDGGETWSIERPKSLQPPPGVRIAGVPAAENGPPMRDCTERIDFSNPGFAMTLRMTSTGDGQSRYYYSTDRGKSWEGACALPNFGQPGIAARTDYLINGKDDLTVFLTAAKSNRREGRVICVRTRDGGQSWEFVSYIGPEPLDYAIMPSSVRLGPVELFSAIRRRYWIDTYRSNDNGETWQFVNQPVVQTGGNPPSLVLMKDGRLAITYGYRLEPYGIRARISDDHGYSWGDEILLREDGGGFDLGYTRTVQRPDGKLVTVYYFNDSPTEERYIGATIWDPGKAE